MAKYTYKNIVFIVCFVFFILPKQHITSVFTQFEKFSIATIGYISYLLNNSTLKIKLILKSEYKLKCFILSNLFE